MIAVKGGAWASRAVLTHVGALVVLAVVFALAGREGPGVSLAAQS